MRLRRIWLALGWLWVATVFWLSLTPHPPQPVHFNYADKVEHALAYGLLMLWFCQLPLRRMRLAVAFVTMGVAIEILQGMGGYRHFEYADMLANTVGVSIGWGLAQTRFGKIFMMLEGNGKH